MRPSAILLICLTVWIPLLPAQEPPAPRPPRISAMEALRILTTETRFGSEGRIAEISGRRGMPGPAVWRITTWDPQSPSRLSSHLIRGRTLEEAGPDTSLYPRHLPEGFFSGAKVRIDSGEAFRIADREAGAARTGFDQIDYRLRCREFSDEAIWSLRLRDADNRPVGHVDLSATSGKVLRTVWFRFDSDGEPAGIEDSAATGLRTSDAASPESSGPERNPPARSAREAEDEKELPDIPLEEPRPENP